MSLNTFDPTYILVLVGDATLLAPAVLVRTRISARLKCVHEHSSPVKIDDVLGINSISKWHVEHGFDLRTRLLM